MRGFLPRHQQFTNVSAFTLEICGGVEKQQAFFPRFLIYFNVPCLLAAGAESLLHSNTVKQHNFLFSPSFFFLRGTVSQQWIVIYSQ